MSNVPKFSTLVKCFKSSQCIFLCFSSDCNICCQKYKTKSKYQHQINQKKQTTSVFCTEIRESPDIPDAYALPAAARTNPMEPEKLLPFSFISISPLQIKFVKAESLQPNISILSQIRRCVNGKIFFSRNFTPLSRAYFGYRKQSDRVVSLPVSSVHFPEFF